MLHCFFLFFCGMHPQLLLVNCLHRDCKVCEQQPVITSYQKAKFIREATVQKKVAKWSSQVDAQKMGWIPGSEAFDDCVVTLMWTRSNLSINFERPKQLPK